MKIRVAFFILLYCTLVRFVVSAQNTTGIFYQSAEWAPDSKTICFAAIIKDSGKYDKTRWEIYTVNADGSDLKNITRNNYADLWPSFSPDGKRIIFQSDRSGNADIFMMNADGSNVQQITSTATKENYAVWRPDGKKILFTSSTDGNEELYQMNPDGSEQQRLTNTTGNEFNASYSGDGKMIVYYYEKGDHHDQLYIANADASNATNISNDTLNNIFPAWTNKNEIIFCANTEKDKKEIEVVNAKNPVEKMILMQDAFFARISPNGKKMVALGGEWKDGIVYICNADGSDKKILIRKEDMIKTDH